MVQAEKCFKGLTLLFLTTDFQTSEVRGSRGSLFVLGHLKRIPEFL